MCTICQHLIAISQADALTIYRANCKQWECNDCRPYKARKLRRELMSGAPTKFITLTVDPSRGESPLDRRKRAGKALQILIKRIKRYYKLATLPYAFIVEATKKGEAHFHGLLRAPFLDQDLIGQWWDELGIGRIVKIKPIKDQRGAAYYLTKYLSKAPAKFGTTKRFWYSRDWKITPAEQEQNRKQTATIRLLKAFTITQYRALLISEGYEIVSCTIDRIEARHPGGPRAPPLWECTTDIDELSAHHAR